jgi:uncharacterized protein (DUF2164 family)
MRRENTRESLTTCIQLTPEQKEEFMEEIAASYQDVRGEKIGIIHQQQILDMFLERLAPLVYNKALDDAQKWYRQQQDNLDSEYFMLYREVR